MSTPDPRDLLAKLMSSSFDGVFAVDGERNVILWNAAMERIFGLTRSEAMGRSLRDLLPFYEETGEARALVAAMGGRAIATREQKFYLPHSGREGWMEAHYAPLRDPDGEMLGVLCVVREITDLKWAEQALAEVRRRQRRLLAQLASSKLRPAPAASQPTAAAKKPKPAPAPAATKPASPNPHPPSRPRRVAPPVTALPPSAAPPAIDPPAMPAAPAETAPSSASLVRPDLSRVPRPGTAPPTAHGPTPAQSSPVEANQTPPPAKPPRPMKANHAGPPPQPPASDSQIFDREAVVGYLRGEEALVPEIAEISLIAIPNMMDQLGEAVETGDGVRIRHLAKELKGTVAAVGGHRATWAAADLERAAEDGRLKDIEELWMGLTFEMKSLCRALRMQLKDKSA